ncbi:hypothetical protein [Phytopseudomonas seleniipraecipitans]|uniref:hypothetical protein n=1 Tax=Phytopseudomonas seleniipraecipitans TaxID=640205 RepID=UPI001428A1C5|nr:hypothetical protein [Pseudomonas seleniipraecipitans]
MQTAIASRLRGKLKLRSEEVQDITILFKPIDILNAYENDYILQNKLSETVATGAIKRAKERFIPEVVQLGR